MTKKNTHRNGNIKHDVKLTEPVAEEDWDTVDVKEYFVPRSRLRREWRKWVRISKTGGKVYSTRCGKDPVEIIILSNSDFDLFEEALARPPRQIPDSIRRATENHNSMVVPDEGTDIIIDPKDVFAQVEADRQSGELSRNVTTAKIRYYQSSVHPDYIEQINTETGERRLGNFENGRFTPREVTPLPDKPVGREFGGPDCEYD